MSLALADFTEKLVPISDFSQGKAGKIFSDVYENNTEYLVLKNNQPTAVVISVNEYKEAQKKIARLEKILEELEYMSNYVEYESMTEEELLSKLLGSLQSPIANFARVLKQIAEKDGGAAEA